MGDTGASAGRQHAFIALIAVAVVLGVLLLLSLLINIILVLWGKRLNKQKRIILEGIHEHRAFIPSLHMSGLFDTPALSFLQSKAKSKPWFHPASTFLWMTR